MPRHLSFRRWIWMKYCNIKQNNSIAWLDYIDVHKSFSNIHFALENFRGCDFIYLHKVNKPLVYVFIIHFVFPGYLQEPFFFVQVVWHIVFVHSFRKPLFLKDGKYDIGDNALLESHLLNVAVDIDINDSRMKPVKLEKRLRIDGAACISHGIHS